MSSILMRRMLRSPMRIISNGGLLDCFVPNKIQVALIMRQMYSSVEAQSRLPKAPCDEELHVHGVPLLRQAASHAKQSRILLSGWPHADGNVDVVSYQTALSKSSVVARLLDRQKKKSSSWKSRLKLEDQQPQQSNFTQPRLVAHLSVPGWEYVACQWGAFGSGFGSVPLSLSHKTPEIEHILSDSEPEMILIGGGSELEQRGLTTSHVPPNEAQLVKAANNVGMTDRIVYLRNIWDDGSDDENACAATTQESFWLGCGGSVSSMDDTALILYTSGTTGKPKGVVISHRNLYHQITDLVSTWGWDATDVALHFLPLHHVHGVVNLLSCAAYSGARLQFQPFDPKALWTSQFNIRRGQNDEGELPKPNVLMAVPTIYAKLLQAADDLPDEIVQDTVQNSLRPMRLMVSGSAALPVPILQRWKDLTGHTLLERYGMTEFAMALSNPYKEDENNRRQPGHVGLPLPSVQVRIMDESGSIIKNDSPRNEGNNDKDQPISGELQVKGPTVFQRYLNQPEKTEEAFTNDGFFRTGDVAEYNTELQSYRILGRASVDIIKTGGYKISALEIERVLLEHPSIVEVAVLGVPDETWGERVGMVCTTQKETEQLNLEDLREWCAERLARYKIPSLLLVVDDIPKNAMGKVNKKDLSKLFHT